MRYNRADSGALLSTIHEEMARCRDVAQLCTHDPQQRGAYQSYFRFLRALRTGLFVARVICKEQAVPDESPALSEATRHLGFTDSSPVRKTFRKQVDRNRQRAVTRIISEALIEARHPLAQQLARKFVQLNHASFFDFLSTPHRRHTLSTLTIPGTTTPAVPPQPRYAQSISVPPSAAGGRRFSLTSLHDGTAKPTCGSSHLNATGSHVPVGVPMDVEAMCQEQRQPQQPQPQQQPQQRHKKSVAFQVSPQPSPQRSQQFDQQLVHLRQSQQLQEQHIQQEAVVPSRVADLAVRHVASICSSTVRLIVSSGGESTKIASRLDDSFAHRGSIAI